MKAVRVSGREMDDLRRADGSFVPPFSLTNTVGAIPGIRRYQIVQDETGLLRVRLEQATAPSPEVSSRIEKGIREVVNEGTQIVVENVTTLEPSPGQKFRIVENRTRRG